MLLNPEMIRNFQRQMEISSLLVQKAGGNNVWTAEKFRSSKNSKVADTFEQLN